MIAQCPTEIKNSPNDFVAYYVVKDGKTSGDKKEDVCFHQIMPSLESAELRLVPRHANEGAVSNDLYLEWMKLCWDNGLIPPAVSYGIDNGLNELTVPKHEYDRHWVYAALCCYRFADAFARMVWLVVENMKQADGKFTFWQALHYAMATEYSYGVGHSFSYICKGASPYNATSPNINLASSIAIREFFRQPVLDRKKDVGYTNAHINTLADSLGGFEVVPSPEPAKDATGLRRYKPPVPKKPILRVESLTELLTSNWTSLYLIEKPTNKELQAIYKQAKVA